jgi:hypothetical protein
VMQSSDVGFYLEGFESLQQARRQGIMHREHGHELSPVSAKDNFFSCVTIHMCLSDFLM